MPSFRRLGKSLTPQEERPTQSQPQGLRRSPPIKHKSASPRVEYQVQNPLSASPQINTISQTVTTVVTTRKDVPVVQVESIDQGAEHDSYTGITISTTSPNIVVLEQSEPSSLSSYSTLKKATQDICTECVVRADEKDSELWDRYVSSLGTENPPPDMQKRLPEPPLAERSARRNPVPSRSYPQHRAPTTAVRQEHRTVYPDPRAVVQEQKNVIVQLQDMISRLDHEKGELLQKNESLNDEIRSLQVSSFKSMDDARWMPMDITAIRSEIDKVRTSIGKLGKDYAVESFRGLERYAQQVSIDTLVADLEHVVNFSRQGVDGFHELLSIKYAPRLCLTAFISDRIHREILANPFFMMDDGLDREFRVFADELCSVQTDVEADKEKRPELATRCALLQARYQHLRGRSNFEAVLRSLWDEGCTYDPSKANTWRSDTLRLVNPQYLTSNKAADQRVHDTSLLIDGTCEALARELAQQIPEHLLARMERAFKDKFEDELVAVFREAGRLSIRLWTQRQDLRFRHLEKLCNQKFEIKSDLLQAHPLHKMDDPEDHSFDGIKAKVVVHPAILAAGTSDAERYEDKVIWAPAVVWLDVEAPHDEGYGVIRR